MSKFLHEPARQTPLAGEFDLCVVGGSCTGVFAAVRAARLGLSVALIERTILFGGMAVAAQVNEWHSLYDTEGKQQIIGGLTFETIERLRQWGAVKDHRRQDGPSFRFNSATLAHVLDELVSENDIRSFLQATCVDVIREGRRVAGVVIEDKTGRRAIRARFFIDASGDGDVLRRGRFGAWREGVMQPVSYQMLVAGLGSPQEASKLWCRARSRASQFAYPLENGMPWFSDYPCNAPVLNVMGARIGGVDASDADSSTLAILEARRRQRALLKMLRAEAGEAANAVSLPHSLGIRETWHAECLHRLTGTELLSGTAFRDAIAYGTYPVDVHSNEGTLLRFLDGRETLVCPDGSEIKRRWRPESPELPRFYQLPFRSLIPREADNLLIAGRLIDADRDAFGAVRVMVVMNQTGEAAGVAAALSLQASSPPSELSPAGLREKLIAGGSLLTTKSFIEV